MPWIHVLIPAVLATAGVGAGAATLLTDDPPPSAAVWIDAPSRDGLVAAGDVAVVAHASAASRIDALTLVVDGEEIDTDSSLDRRGRLVYGELTWHADGEGEHEIVVRQTGGAGVASQPVRLAVVADGAGATEEPDPTPTPTATDETPTPTPTEETIDPDLDGGSAVAIGEVGFGGEPRVSVRASCGDSVLVYAQVIGADRAYVDIRGLRRIDMTTARGDQWSATIDSGWDIDQVGTYPVTVVVPDGETEIVKSVGTLSIEEGCIDP